MALNTNSDNFNNLTGYDSAVELAQAGKYEQALVYMRNILKMLKTIPKY